MVLREKVYKDPQSKRNKKGMSLKKKAMFFTLLTIAILAIYIFFFTIHNYTRISEKTEVTEKRILSVDDFLKDVKRDLERGLFISGFRALLASNEYIINQNKFIDDIELRVQEGILNGTINGTSSVVLQGSTFSDWMQKIEYQGSKLKVTLNITLLNLEVYHEDPWFVTIGANLSFEVVDDLGTATFEQTDYITANVDIIGFEDPLYIMNGYGRLTNIVNKTPYSGNFTDQTSGTWNVSRLLDHTYTGYYTANTDAPSFIQRFENNMTASEYGIESLVDLAEFASQGLPIYDYSIVDHHYFFNDSTTNYRINFTPSWFKIDDSHRAIYGVTAISYQP